jgi:hypothetical protein
VNSRIENAVNQGLEAQAAIRAQSSAIAAMGSRANDIVGVVAEGGYRFMVIAWHSARRGFWRFQGFLAELQRARIIADADALSPAEIAALRGPFDEGLRRALEGFVDPSSLSAGLRAALPSTAIDDAAAFGRFLGLEDNEVIDVLETQARVAREADPSALSPDALRNAMRERAGGGLDASRSRSLSDTSGRTAEEAAALGEEVVSAGGRLDRFERHHSVFVYVLRAIQARRAGRPVQSVTGVGSEGFRQIVDTLFWQGDELVMMDRMTHASLHRALNDVLDEMLEPQRVIDLIARRGAVEGFGPGRRVVESGGAQAMMRRLQSITEHELVDIVEEAYRRVFNEHPGLLSDEMIQETFLAIERVRQGL